MQWLEKYGDHAYALLRIMAGFMFSFHGAQKILGILSDVMPQVGSQLWLGGMIELLGGVALLVSSRLAKLAMLVGLGLATILFLAWLARRTPQKSRHRR